MKFLFPEPSLFLAVTRSEAGWLRTANPNIRGVALAFSIVLSSS